MGGFDFSYKEAKFYFYNIMILDKKYIPESILDENVFLKKILVNLHHESLEINQHLVNLFPYGFSQIQEMKNNKKTNKYTCENFYKLKFLAFVLQKYTREFTLSMYDYLKKNSLLKNDVCVYNGDDLYILLSKELDLIELNFKLFHHVYNKSGFVMKIKIS